MGKKSQQHVHDYWTTKIAEKCNVMIALTKKKAKQGFPFPWFQTKTILKGSSQ